MDFAPSLRLNNGIDIPQLAFGTSDDSREAVQKAVEVAIETGFRHIDSAMFYGVEKEVGLAVADAIRKHNLKREDFFITSKLWCDSHAPDIVRKTCEQSLKNFGLTYLDLYLIHWPVSFHLKDGANYDLMDSSALAYEYHKLEDTWKAMEELVHVGLVKSIGVSNFNKRQLERILAAGTIPPAVNQVEVNLHCLNAKLIEFCHSKGIQVAAYAPLGATGPMKDELGSPMDLECVIDIAKRHNKTPAQVLLRHAFQRNLVVISKSITPERIKSNYMILDFELSNDEMDVLRKAGVNRRYFEVLAFKGHPEYPFHDDY
ncbi:unnamed protein product [Rodentolepis nana]|uniref:Aldo_ket_red domain-containing protein n=1 Tax=Rodentolepis nana TaxID=102285 RepID=A0A0R3TAU0_RODNA|nr:unnamed protein product [Rodentolepis nana]